MQGQMAQAALAWTSGLGFFSKDQRRRTPSRRSITLREKNNNLYLLDTERDADMIFHPHYIDYSAMCRVLAHDLFS